MRRPESSTGSRLRSLHRSGGARLRETYASDDLRPDAALTVRASNASGIATTLQRNRCSRLRTRSFEPPVGRTQPQSTAPIIQASRQGTFVPGATLTRRGATATSSCDTTRSSRAQAEAVAHPRQSRSPARRPFRNRAGSLAGVMQEFVRKGSTMTEEERWLIRGTVRW